MSREEIEKKVIRVLAEQTLMDEGAIHPDSSLIDDLGMDSFDAVQVACEFEEQYGVEISDDDVRGFTKVFDIVEYIRNRLKKNQKNNPSLTCLTTILIATVLASHWGMV